MKSKALRRLFCIFMILLMLLVPTVSATAAEASAAEVTLVTAVPFHYEHDPRLNPAAMQDIIVNPDAVYGFSPNPESGRLSSYADFDWGDPQLVEESRQARIAYHEDFRELYTLKDQLAAEGKGIEEIARAVSAQRNILRLRAYESNPEGLAAAKASNLLAYGNENGPTADSLYEKYGSWEVVLEKAFSTNSGMDACLGLYDEYYSLYVLIGQIHTCFYSDAMQWAYSCNLTHLISYDPKALCTRAEAVTLLWRAAGCPSPGAATSQFADLPLDCSYTAAVLWAEEQGITSGTSAVTFSPDAVITRAQLITMLCAFCSGSDWEPEEQTCFGDVSAAAYYSQAVSWAVDNHITYGTSASAFSPNAACSLGEAVTFLWRANAA